MCMSTSGSVRVRIFNDVEVSMWGVFLERGRTSLDSDPSRQYLRHTFIHDNICWRIEGGTFSAST